MTADPIWGSRLDGVSIENQFEWLAYNSRYTSTERPQEHPETVEHVTGLLDGLTEAQRTAAEMIGMASLSGEAAAKLIGKHPQSMRLAWYRTVEKFTGSTPTPLEHARERKRRQRAKNPPKPRQRSPENPLTANERNKRYIANLRRIERETGETPPALANLRARKREQARRRKARADQNL